MSDGALRLRIATAGGVLAVAFAVVALRAAQLALLEGPALRERAARQQAREVIQRPQRGEIRDRNAEPLAITRDSLDIWARPALVPSDPELLALLARAIGVPAATLQRRIGRVRPFVWLRRGAPLRVEDDLRRLGVPGVGWDMNRSRQYPHGPLAAQVVGFVNIDGRGLEGLERSLDGLLRGRAETVQMVRDARGRSVEVGDDVPGDPALRQGAHVTLTLDAYLQELAEQELEAVLRRFRAKAATAVVMDPRSGEVLAMANVPRFDPNRFWKSSPAERRNRAITDVYEPGSTMKGILAAAALEAGVVRPGERIDCGHGAYRVGGRTIHDHEPHGLLSFVDVVRYSSNIGSAKVAQRLGVRRYAAALRRFGFGRPTGIELPGEVSGLIRPEKSWKPIDLVTAAYGQGLAVTPLQMARAYAVIANGGRQVLPHVVREVSDAEGSLLYRFQSPPLERVLSAATAAAVRDMLVAAVEEGTGRAAAIPGIAVAGKTGTAQKVDHATGRYSARDYVASFVGFAPANDPRVVVLVVVDSPRGSHYGGVVAAPVFRRITEKALERARVYLPPPPVPVPADLGHVMAVSITPGLTAASSPGFPDLHGLALREVLVLARKNGWRLQIDGSGYVVDQDPPPGGPGNEQHVRIRLGSEGG